MLTECLFLTAMRKVRYFMIHISDKKKKKKWSLDSIKTVYLWPYENVGHDQRQIKVNIHFTPILRKLIKRTKFLIVSYEYLH